MPLDLFSDCFVKKETVKGINGKTHGVNNAINPPKNPSPNTIQRAESPSTAFNSFCCKSTLFFKSSFKEFVNENPGIWTEKLTSELYHACKTIIAHEDAFIDLAFEMGPMEGLTAQEVKDYIRFIASRRLDQLGLDPIYDIQKNPLTWLDTMLNAVEHMNFFEGRATEYSKASTQGTWTEAFS